MGVLVCLTAGESLNALSSELAMSGMAAIVWTTSDFAEV